MKNKFKVFVKDLPKMTLFQDPTTKYFYIVDTDDATLDYFVFFEKTYDETNHLFFIHDLTDKIVRGCGFISKN